MQTADNLVEVIVRVLEWFVPGSDASVCTECTGIQTSTSRAPKHYPTAASPVGGGDVRSGRISDISSCASTSSSRRVRRSDRFRGRSDRLTSCRKLAVKVLQKKGTAHRVKDDLYPWTKNGGRSFILQFSAVLCAQGRIRFGHILFPCLQ